MGINERAVRLCKKTSQWRLIVEGRLLEPNMVVVATDDKEDPPDEE